MTPSKHTAITIQIPTKTGISIKDIEKPLENVVKQEKQAENSNSPGP
jgi:hypothetical protein